MKKKYFTDEEKRLAKNIQQKKYYDKIKKAPLSEEEKNLIRKQKEDARAKYVKEYYIKNKDRIREYGQEYFKKNKKVKLKKNSDRYRKRRELNPLFRLSTNLKRSIRGVISRNGFTKKSKTIEILGCTFDELKLHIQSQFQPWMTWDNYGLYNGELNYGWDVDHIIPLATATSEADVVTLNHYTNLQPLCSKINRNVKRDNVKRDNVKRDNVLTVRKDVNISKSPSISCFSAKNGVYS